MRVLERGWARGQIEEVGRNRHVGAVAWLLHRITGLALTAYVFMHFWVLGGATAGRPAFDARLAAAQSGALKVLEVLLVAAVAFHLLNGLRVTFLDFFRFTRLQQALAWVVFALFFAVSGWTAWVFFGRVLG